jgi:hypothetical protein
MPFRDYLGGEQQASGLAYHGGELYLCGDIKRQRRGLPCVFLKNQKSKQEGVSVMPSGGFRVGAGRPRKNPIEKELEGKQKKPAAAPKPKAPPVSRANSEALMVDYFAAALKECAGEVPSVDALRTEINDYIAAMGCAEFVPPQVITDYIIHRQGYLACEMMNRKIGRMTKDYKLSPYVTAGQAYYKSMQGDFNLILQIVQRHGGEKSENTNQFLALLMNRGF